MKSLEEANRDALESWQNSLVGQAEKSGIECPKCGEELWDTDPTTILTTFPPQLAIHCDCGYRGYRVR